MRLGQEIVVENVLVHCSFFRFCARLFLGRAGITRTTRLPNVSLDRYSVPLLEQQLSQSVSSIILIVNCRGRTLRLRILQRGLRKQHDTWLRLWHHTYMLLQKAHLQIHDLLFCSYFIFRGSFVLVLNVLSDLEANSWSMRGEIEKETFKYTKQGT